MKQRSSTGTDWIVVVLGAVGILLCWWSVRWAFGGSLFFYGDEIGNLTSPVGYSYRELVHFLPEIIYNDRPVGTIFETFLFRTFGLHYGAQLPWFLLFTLQTAQ